MIYARSQDGGPAPLAKVTTFRRKVDPAANCVQVARTIPPPQTQKATKVEEPQHKPTVSLDDDREDRLAELGTLSTAGLRACWEQVFKRSAPRRISRDPLLRALAYLIQEQAEGGLKRRRADAWPSLPSSTARTVKRYRHTRLGSNLAVA